MAKPLSTNQKLILLACVLLIAVALTIVYWASKKAAHITGPGATAVDAQGRLWLNADQALFIIDAAGNIVRELDLRAIGVTPPIASLSAFRDGEMLVGSRTSGEIHRLNAEGQNLGRLGGGAAPAWKPFGAFHLAYHPTKRRILLTDPSNHRVLLLDEQGGVVRESPAQGAHPIYRFPNSVIVNDAGHFLVVDTNNRRVLTLDPALETRETWSPVESDAHYRYPVFIAQIPGGDYYLSLHDNRLDYAEVVRLNRRGERQGTVTFESKVIVNGLVAGADGVLIVDSAAFAIWRVHADGAGLSRFGGPRLQDFMRKTQEAKAFHESLVSLAQRSLVVMLAVLLLVAAVLQARQQKQSARVPLPMEHAAMPPLQIWAAFKQSILLLPILLLPMVLALSLLVQIYGICARSPSDWLMALGGNVIVLLPLFGLAWLCRHAYRHGIRRGRYHRLFVRRAHTLLGRHRAVLSGALAPDEQVLGVQLGVLARLPVVMVITKETRWVMTLSLFGTHVRRLQAISLAAIAAPKVEELGGFRSYLKYLGMPMWQFHFTEAGTRRRYAIHLPDGYGADWLVENIKQQGATFARTGGGVRDGACPDCIAPGRNVAVATALSLIFPGLGQFYAEEMYKGLVFLISGAFMGLTLLEPVVAYFYRTKDLSLTATIVAAAMLLALWAIALVDAVRTTRRNRLNGVGIFATE